MILLIPLLLVGFVIAISKWALGFLDSRTKVFITAIGIGWAGYVVIGMALPHTDPQIWHLLIAPAFGATALLVGSILEIKRAG